MESNRDEAERCFSLGSKYESAGDLPRAAKFYQKSEQLFPSTRASTRLQAVEANLQGKAKDGSRHQDRSHSTHHTPHSESHSPDSSASSQGTQGTAAELELVRRVRASKNYYDTLGVKRDASPELIKKGYKKLALQLHPDKNNCPGAEECFKKVGQAFACLSDASKRRMYDVSGSEEPAMSGMRHRHHQYDSELTPEEIFAAFFGGGIPMNNPQRGRNGTPFRMYTYHSGGRANARPAQGQEQANPSISASCMTLLPFLLIILMGLFSQPSAPLYRLQPNGQYQVSRETSTMKVHFFVKPEFSHFDPTTIRKIESMVESEWVEEMQQQCTLERRHQAAAERTARYRGDKPPEPKMKACDELKTWGIPPRRMSMWV